MQSLQDVRAGSFKALVDKILDLRPTVQDIVPSIVLENLHAVPVKMALTQLQNCRYLLPNKHEGMSRLDSLILPLLTIARALDETSCREDFELPGRFTVSNDPFQTAIDDTMCSVFYDPSVVRVASNLLGVNYLAETQDALPARMSGTFFGNLHRILVPVIVEDYPVVKLRSAPDKRLSIIMMYDTGSTMSYFTLEVLQALGYTDAKYPQSDELHPSTMYPVKINGMAHSVGLCPRTRCEHVCLLGQTLLVDYKVKVEVDYKQRTIVMEANL